MSDTETTVHTLVQQCLDADAATASDTLSALLGPKIVDAIQAKKIEIAQNMYGAPQDDSSPVEGQTAAAGQEEEHENA
jgi:hypothetical protein